MSKLFPIKCKDGVDQKHFENNDRNLPKEALWSQNQILR